MSVFLTTFWVLAAHGASGKLPSSLKYAIPTASPAKDHSTTSASPALALSFSAATPAKLLA